MKARLILLATPLLIFPFLASAQEEDLKLTVDTPVNLDFEKEEEPINTPKKKKRKKKVFYGIKTKKGFTRKGVGERVTYELFYYLKKSEKPQTFVRDVYWYDFKRKEIRKTTLTSFKETDGVLLHGPYEKRLNTIVIEKGIFYKGTRHGRWLTYDRDSVLKDKAKYIRGWPKESTVTYYDPQSRKKMKELTPVEYGEKQGYYYLFHENGQVAVQGEYAWDQKVGDWTEYYTTGKRKKIVAYPKKAFDKEIRPYIKAEWNDKGKEIYRNTKVVN
jgi:antitoxin component YwqK of YwqJK toxin-antitoxin module